MTLFCEEFLQQIETSKTVSFASLRHSEKLLDPCPALYQLRLLLGLHSSTRPCTH